LGEISIGIKRADHHSPRVWIVEEGTVSGIEDAGQTCCKIAARDLKDFVVLDEGFVIVFSSKKWFVTPPSCGMALTNNRRAHSLLRAKAKTCRGFFKEGFAD
jgi:hypothetical protein